MTMWPVHNQNAATIRMTIGAIAKWISLRAFHWNGLQSGQSCFCFGLRSYCEHKLIVVKQFTNIPINHGPFKEKPKTCSNFTVPVFLQYIISSLMHQKVWFSPKNWQKSIVNLQKDFQKRKLIIYFLFPATGSVTCRSYYLPRDTHWHPKTPFYTQGPPLYG